MMRRLSRARHDLRTQEDGVSLLLALLFIVVIGILLAALLPYSKSGVTAAVAVRDVRTVQHAVDGGMDGAINSIRGSFIDGTQGDPTQCPQYLAPDFAAPKSADGVALGGVTKVVVKCKGLAGGFVADDEAAFAIKTLVGGVTVSGNTPLEVFGPIWSKGAVTTGGPFQKVAVSGDVFSESSTCDNIEATGVVHCPLLAGDPTGADPLASDADPMTTPRDPAAGGGPLPADPYGTCANNQSVVKFLPGYYSESPQPDPVGCTGNAHDVWWFSPGVYYFDFPDASYTRPSWSTAVNYVNGQASWSIAGVAVLGGAAKGFTETSKSSDVRALMPGACDVNQEGVNFIFGGPTNISVASGERLELCPAKLGTKERRIALYGWRGNATRPATSTTMLAVPQLPAAVTVTDRFQPAPAARATDGTSAVAAFVGGAVATEEATIQLDDFQMSGPSGNAPATIPDGSLVTGLRLRVTHQESTNKLNSSITYSSATVPATTVTVAPNTGASLVTTDLPIALPTTHRWKTVRDLLAGLSVRYDIDGSSLTDPTTGGGRPRPGETATAWLDGVEVEVAYVPPALQGTRCPSGVTPCVLLKNTVTNANEDNLSMYGTVYTPDDTLDVSVHNSSTTVFKRGVIAGSLTVNVSPSTKQTEAPFQIPGFSTARVVLFTAYVDENGTLSRPRLRARVRYVDSVKKSDGTTFARPGNVVTVEEWTVLR